MSELEELKKQVAVHRHTVGSAEEGGYFLDNYLRWSLDALDRAIAIAERLSYLDETHEALQGVVSTSLDAAERLKCERDEAKSMAHCDCVRRMRSVRYNQPEFDYAIVNAAADPLPGWITDQLVQTVCTQCGAKFYVGRLGELLLSIETSAKLERDEARALCKQLAAAVGTTKLKLEREALAAYEEQSKGWT